MKIAASIVVLVSVLAFLLAASVGYSQLEARVSNLETRKNFVGESFTVADEEGEYISLSCEEGEPTIRLFDPETGVTAAGLTAQSGGPVLVLNRLKSVNAIEETGSSLRGAWIWRATDDGPTEVSVDPEGFVRHLRFYGREPEAAQFDAGEVSVTDILSSLPPPEVE